jgi:hypothetical protein
MSRSSTVSDNNVLRVQILRQVDYAPLHPIRRQDKISVEHINHALLHLAVLTDVGEASNHDQCENVSMNRSRPVFQLHVFVEVVEVLLDSVNIR